MKLRPGPAWACIAGLSVGGAVAAHEASYLLVHPDPHARDAALHFSGHGYWDLAVFGALALVMAALFARMGGAFLAARRVSGEPTSLRSQWARLALVQVGVFSVAEVAERSVSGTLASITTEWAVRLGLPILLVVALIGALVLRMADRAGVALARRMRRPRPQSTTVQFPIGRISVVRSTLLDCARRTRAPPLSVAS